MLTVQAHILSWFEGRLAGLSLEKPLKDSKTRLQEYLQSKRLALPDYILDKVEGEAHEQTFYITCTVAELDNPVNGVGSSRRQAEQEAARAALEQLKLGGAKL
ncbi:MAG: putative dsRNA-binding protein, partial [Pseudomonadales bacterium]